MMTAIFTQKRVCCAHCGGELDDEVWVEVIECGHCGTMNQIMVIVREVK